MSTLQVHENAAWLLQAELDRRAAAYRLVSPPPRAQIKWSEIVELTRSELLPWVPDFLAHYQKLGVVFAMRAPDESAHLHMPTGCLTGDTELVVNRGGCARRMRLDQLVARFNGQPAVRAPKGPDARGRQRSKGRVYAPWRKDIITNTQSHANGYIRLNQVVAAYETGVRDVFEVRTKSGKRLRSTADHRYLVTDVSCYAKLSELRLGDQIGQVVDAGGSTRARKSQYLQVQGMQHHPQACYVEIKRKDNTRAGRVEQVWRVPAHRLVAEAAMNGLDFNVYITRLRAGNIEGLRFLDATLHVHHKDENPQNNELDNLEVLSVEEHLRKHGEENWRHVTARVVPDEIIGITHVGEEATFDLTMADPYNNYVANGFVVHNSGKSLCGLVWGLSRLLPIIFITKAAARGTIRREFERYTNVKPIVLLPKSERKASAPDPVEEINVRLERGESPRVVIAAWESLELFLDVLLKCAPYSLVADESHMIKDHRRWIAVKGVCETGQEEIEFTRRKNRAALAQRLGGNARRRLLLTATPIADRPRDWWAQGDLAHPKSFGKFWDFCARYTDLTKTNQGYLENKGKSNLDELDKRLAFVRYSVDYSVTHRELPPKRRQVVFIEKAQQGKPGAFAKELKRAQQTGGKAIREVLLAEAASRKLPVVLDYVKDSCGSGGKVVVFTGRHNDCERLDQAIAKALPGLPRWMAHGGHGTVLRDEVREAFMDAPGPACLVGTAQAWGASISLNDADLAIMAMLPQTPKDLWQCEGRFHRQGQKRNVLILYPIAEGTIDERMNALLISKLGAVADLQHDSDFMQAETDLKSSGLDDETFTARLLDKILGGLEGES